MLAFFLYMVYTIYIKESKGATPKELKMKELKEQLIKAIERYESAAAWDKNLAGKAKAGSSDQRELLEAYHFRCGQVIGMKEALKMLTDCSGNNTETE